MKLRSNRTYILPTRYGVIFGIVILIEFMVSITFGHPFAYLITFISSSIIFMSAIYTNSSFQSISTLPIQEDLVEVSQNVIFRLPLELSDKFENKSFRVCDDQTQIYRDEIVTFDKAYVDIYIGEQMRGVHHINRVKLSTTFPFGLFRAWRYFDIDRKLYIYPKLINSNELMSVMQSNHSSNESVDKVGQNNEDFLEHKKALETDSWRHIDWKAYASGKGLLSKVYTSHCDNAYRVDLYKGSSEEQISTATSLLFKYYNESKGIEFYVDDQLLFSGSDQDTLKQSIKFLCLFNRNIA
ncbi:hypothetical protein [Halobacteriovorax sp. HLS]|uniref:hypothetical protein n=1 Tax=Halobacteriovorax sp. HLS TaxID=2234000 RepID=UPI000FDA4ABB|nr:hypothetical protein [Halobacteriovorax sp. HLS]